VSKERNLDGNKITIIRRELGPPEITPQNQIANKILSTRITTIKKDRDISVTDKGELKAGPEYWVVKRNGKKIKKLPDSPKLRKSLNKRFWKHPWAKNK
jgi:hypothetical protein